MSEVDAWFSDCDNPQVALMQKVRRAILAADPRMTESIKWKTPTFEYRGPMASINPRAKKFVSLMFHRGAEIPGKFPSLEGDGMQARSMKILDEADLATKTAELTRLSRAWCDSREQ